jgi:hypothetical protein
VEKSHTEIQRLICPACEGMMHLVNPSRTKQDDKCYVCDGRGWVTNKICDGCGRSVYSEDDGILYCGRVDCLKRIKDSRERMVAKAKWDARQKDKGTEFDWSRGADWGRGRRVIALGPSVQQVLPDDEKEAFEDDWGQYCC